QRAGDQCDVGGAHLAGEQRSEVGGLAPALAGEWAVGVAQAVLRLGLGVPQEDQEASAHHCPIAWTPPSTWTISAVVAGNQSEHSATTARAAGSASLTSQPSGARSSHVSSIWSKPGMEVAAVVRIGPAETRLTRMPSGPRSRAR